MAVKELVIVGEEEIGKTTLANALLGWDIFPQSTWDLYIPTEQPASQMLTDHIRLTDTPGYDLLWYQVPEAVNEAVSRADTIIMMFKGFYTEEDVDPEFTNQEELEEYRRWVESPAQEEKLLKELLAKAKTRDIYFVIPFYSEDGPLDQEELDRDLTRAKERFASFSDHGEKAFFCIDPMMALIAAIEDDNAALEASGILLLKAALLGGEE
jgi:hypothetical protein